MTRPAKWEQLRAEWSVLSYYQRFEKLVATVLTVVVGLIILVALYRLTFSVIAGLLLGVLDPLDHSVFQAVFGEILTLLIALEFNHTIQYVVKRDQSIIQTKVVLLIALLAVARKFIILDLKDVSTGQLPGLAAITIALGLAYWLMRERDDRLGDAPLGRTELWPPIRNRCVAGVPHGATSCCLTFRSTRTVSFAR